ncbi:MAG: UDP-3-O-(3-hydroxymyristoyl)glucosamine N-acyltransferase [Planctomycetota bacterium]
MSDLSVADLAELAGGRVLGDGAVRIHGVAPLELAGPGDLGFVRHPKYVEAAGRSGAGAILCGEPLEIDRPQIVVADVAVAYAKIASALYPPREVLRHSVHATAVVDPQARIEEPVEIGPGAVIGRCSVGGGTILHAGVVVGDGSSIGSGCTLHPRVVIYPGVRIGDRVTVHAGSVLGSDGFGYANESGTWLKVPQLGGCVIGDDVEIGANCTIDRGALGDTTIGRGCKIDNLCHIAHNVSIGEHTAMAAGCMIAGSARIGARVTCGGHVVMAGHIAIADDVRIGGNSAAIRDVEEAGDYMGWPLMEKRQFARHMRVLRELVETQSEVEELKRRLAHGLDEG